MATILESRSVTKKFGGLLAVNNFSLEVPEGSISCIIGPNGAGKTTFFNCVVGFYLPEEGEIIFDGQPIQGMPPYKITALGISRTYQNIRLFSNMTAIENIMVGQHAHTRATMVDAILHTPRNRNEEKGSIEEAQRLLEFVGLTGAGDILARNLPYGAQRRLEIARALGNKPKLLLLDEPTAGMNPYESAELTGLIKRLRDEFGSTILLIEHDMRVVMEISERITVLDYGSKIAEGNAKQIQSNPEVIEAYLGRGAASGLALSSD